MFRYGVNTNFRLTKYYRRKKAYNSYRYYLFHIGLNGYSLYQLNNFYVEVQYNGGINAITKFTSFSTDTKLKSYLDKIDISGAIEP